VSTPVNAWAGMREAKSAAVAAALLLDSTPTRAAKAGDAASATTTTAAIAQAAIRREEADFMEIRISCPGLEVGPISATNSVALRVARYADVAKTNSSAKALLTSDLLH
jgi:hypothetical protein